MMAIKFGTNKFGAVSGIDDDGNEFIICDDDTLYINEVNFKFCDLEQILIKMKELKDDDNIRNKN